MSTFGMPQPPPNPPPWPPPYDPPPSSEDVPAAPEEKRHSRAFRAAAGAGVAILVAGGVAAAVLAFGVLRGTADSMVTFAPSDTAVYVNLDLQPSVGQQLSLNSILGKFPGLSGSSRHRPDHSNTTELLQALRADARRSVGPIPQGHRAFPRIPTCRCGTEFRTWLDPRAHRSVPAAPPPGNRSRAKSSSAASTKPTAMCEARPPRRNPRGTRDPAVDARQSAAVPVHGKARPKPTNSPRKHALCNNPAMRF